MNRRENVWVVGAALSTLIIVPVLLQVPETAWTLLAIPCWLLIKTPTGRLLLFIAGILLVLGTKAGVSTTKIVFFGMIVLLMAIAAYRVLRDMRSHQWVRHLQVMMLGAGMLLLLVLLAFVVGIVQGEPITSVIRDSLTYLLIVAAVPIGLDAASSASPKLAVRITAAVTVVASVSFSLAFLSSRGAATLTLDRLGLPSMMALSVGVALGLVYGMGGPLKRSPWILFAAFPVFCVLVTGGRAGLVLLAAAIGIVGSRRAMRVPLRRMIVGLVALGTATAGALLLASSTILTAGFLDSRIQASITVIQQGRGQDQSGTIRVRAANQALEEWRQHLFFGSGFGHSFPNPSPGGGVVEFQMDTSSLFLAKFGLVGTVLLLVAIFMMIRPAFGSIAGTRLTAQTIMAGSAAVWVCELYFGAPTEDKGFSIAILLLTILIGTALRNHVEPPTALIGGQPLALRLDSQQAVISSSAARQ